MNRFRYVVELARCVPSPEYGPHAHWRSYIRREFPFGKSVGVGSNAARDEAYLYARTMLGLASVISVSRMNGGCGTVDYVKNDPDSRFPDWTDCEKATNVGVQ